MTVTQQMIELEPKLKTELPYEIYDYMAKRAKRYINKGYTVDKVLFDKPNNILELHLKFINHKKKQIDRLIIKHQ